MYIIIIYIYTYVDPCECGRHIPRWVAHRSSYCHNCCSVGKDIPNTSHTTLCFDAHTGVRNPNDKAGSDNGQDSAGVHSNFPEVSQSVCIAMHSYVICSCMRVRRCTSRWPQGLMLFNKNVCIHVYGFLVHASIIVYPRNFSVNCQDHKKLDTWSTPQQFMNGSPVSFEESQARMSTEYSSCVGCCGQSHDKARWSQRYSAAASVKNNTLTWTQQHMWLDIFLYGMYVQCKYSINMYHCINSIPSLCQVLKQCAIMYIMFSQLLRTITALASVHWCRVTSIWYRQRAYILVIVCILYCTYQNVYLFSTYIRGFSAVTAR